MTVIVYKGDKVAARSKNLRALQAYSRKVQLCAVHVTSDYDGATLRAVWNDGALCTAHFAGATIAKQYGARMAKLRGAEFTTQGYTHGDL